jgi:hypothetical protein
MMCDRPTPPPQRTSLDDPARSPTLPSAESYMDRRSSCYRPVSRSLRRIDTVTRTSVTAGVPIHPGYALQGETLAALLDAERDERGRARLSCVCCIFTQSRHLVTALQRAPGLIEPYIRRVQAYEHATDYTCQQRGASIATMFRKHIHEKAGLPGRQPLFYFPICLSSTRCRARAVPGVSGAEGLEAERDRAHQSAIGRRRLHSPPTSSPTAAEVDNGDRPLSRLRYRRA